MNKEQITNDDQPASSADKETMEDPESIEDGSLSAEEAGEPTATLLKEQEYLNGWKRAQADYKNLQTQMESERATTRRYAKHSAVMTILPLYTNFGLASEHLPEELEGNTWAQGILHIRTQFTQILEEMGVKEIAVANGQAFNPTFHEAVSQEKSEDAESGTIIKILAKGFTLDDEVVMPTKVVVAE